MLTALVQRLADPRPRDRRVTKQLSAYRRLDPRWHEWSGARSATEGGERTAVAGEVDELVRQSGLTLAAFADRIGTSASRMSTYRSGRVIPSAALLLRMRRLVERLRAGDP
ncbi:MAG: helix-turn-helix domain-containing protein [Intrasporangium sp.]|uniref:helix-turn-helix domain-containing protein n=1 Tax=Intrasporangium sp. TaxID=1925024 RepID=UPI00264960BE|nr:helix-turn-helix transcriptional regulator [Intrasporangium sp.]MDN5795764.1 helix-turn-helix domain-containing protein [Intrasporangium sp.]